MADSLLRTRDLVVPDLDRDDCGGSYKEWLEEAWSDTLDSLPPADFEIEGLDYDTLVDKTSEEEERDDHDAVLIRPLMQAINEQFREMVHNSYNTKTRKFEQGLFIKREANTAIIGGVQVVKAADLMNLYTLTFNRVMNERLGKATNELFAAFKDRCSFFAANHVARNLMKVNEVEAFLHLLAATSHNYAIYVGVSTKPLSCLDNTRAYSVHENRPPIIYHAIEKFYDDVYMMPGMKRRICKALVHEHRLLRADPSRSRDVYKNVITYFFDFMENFYDAYQKDYQQCIVNEAEKYYETMVSYFLDGKATETSYFTIFPDFMKVKIDGLALYIDVVDRLLSIERTLQKEIHKEGTVKTVMGVVEHNLIERVVGRIFTKESLGAIFKEKEFAITRKVFDMFHKHQPALKVFADCFRSWVEAQRLKVVQEATSTFDSYRKTVGSRVSPAQIGEYEKNKTFVVKKMIACHVEEDRMMKEIFSNDFQLGAELKITRENMTELKVGVHEQHDLLPVFLDRCVRGLEPGTPDEIKNYINFTCEYYSLLRKKDVFMNLHLDLMARRFLSEEVEPDLDLEALVIEGLKKRSGPAFTHRAETMVKDYLGAADITAKFLHSCLAKVDGSVKYNFQIITDGCWPLHELQYINDINLDEQLLGINNIFLDFYTTEYSSRRLEYLHRWATAIIRFQPDYNDGKSVMRLQCNSHQATILFLFKTVATEIAVADIEKIVGVGESDYFKRLIGSLCSPKVPVLKYDEGGGKLSVNVDFDTKGVEILKLPLPLVERPQKMPEVQEDKSYAIQAAITALLKKKQRMEHSDILEQIGSQFLSSFTASEEQIKDGLDALQDRGYIERDPVYLERYVYCP